jgi:membrane protein
MSHVHSAPATPPARRTDWPISARMFLLRQRYPWLDRLARAGTRYVEYHGYHYAASITYFSVLSLMPMLMVAVAVTGFVLTGAPALFGQFQHAIVQAMPPSLVGPTESLLGTVVDHRVKIGVLGVLIGLYSGWNWMNALRDALTAMWQQERTRQRLIPMVLKDLLALAGLSGALVLSFALSAVGSTLGPYLVRLAHVGWLNVPLVILSLALAIVANWLVFIWVLAKLPREPVDARNAVRGGLVAAIGFELLKWLGGGYLQLIGRSPLGIAFGWVVGVLVFIYLVARMLMLVTAWTAVGRRGSAPRHADRAPLSER